jgi:hypothetical protein
MGPLEILVAALTVLLVGAFFLGVMALVRIYFRK